VTTSLRVVRLAAVMVVSLGALMLGGQLLGVAPAGADGHQGYEGGNILYVSNSPEGHQGVNAHIHGQWDGSGQWDGHGRWGCSNAQYSTIQSAVTAAPNEALVVVCPGTYAEDVSVPHPVQLVGLHATVNAAALVNGFVVTSSYVSIKGFTVTGALAEGIVAEPAGVLTNPQPPSSPSQTFAPIHHVSIENDVVNANNTGGDPTTHQCSESPTPPDFLYPGDCGGGIHLNTVAHSEVEGNTVTNNDDGILITDDYGPAYGNEVSHNYVAHNIYECGIVLPSHNPFSVVATQNPDHVTYSVGALTPSTGGVYDNTVDQNTVVDNGTVVAPGFGGSGSGVGVFAPSAGTAAYDNTITDNYITGSGQAGFTIHAHYTGGEYVSGNQVTDNVFATNNTGGDGLDGPGTDPDFKTTAILVFSSEPATITIAHNHIHGNTIGVWLSANIQASGLASNFIGGAATPIYVSQVPYAFAQTIAATAPTATVGVLIVPNNLTTQYYVEYGLTSTPYSMTTTAVTGLTGLAPVVAPVSLPGLSSGQTYHYQVVASNSQGTTYGGDQTFST
jgi:parallel beta-helix repeat protein